ncbi:MAG TPA: hypothetical protein VGJ20_44205 [Xanthobacteraceae bacterium]
MTPGTERLKDRKSGFVGDNGFAVDQAGACRQCCNGFGNPGKRSTDGIAGIEPHARPAVRLKAEIGTHKAEVPRFPL